ncbi:MAG: DUF2306 domain-containing protein [Aureispira sp.]|nr:DUF2306 domain-containing protein [Aureispira sp.]
MRQTISYILWLFIIFFALKLSAIALSYFSFDMNYHFLKAKQDMLDNKLWVSFFYIHLFFGVIATLGGLVLFLPKLINYNSKLHKNVGKAYVIAILFFTGPTGLYLSFSAEGGQWASLGFIMMSTAWMIPTYIAYKKIIQKDIKAHYRWMIRSYSMTLSGVTLRIMTPIGSLFVGFEEDTNFIISSFVWIFNVILGEVILLTSTKKQDSLLAMLTSK